MPTYPFYCDDCDHEWEQFMPIKSSPFQRCPKCNGSTRRRVGGGSGIIFKAAGFPGNDAKQLASLARGEHRSDTEG